MWNSALLSILRSENRNLLSNFGFMFIVTGIAIQLLTYCIGGGSAVSVLSGIFGVMSVVLCSQRKVAFYILGFAQLLTYVYLCLGEKFYGEIAENLFYFVTMLYGIYHWSKNYDDDMHEVETRKLSLTDNILMFALVVIGIGVLYVVLYMTNDTQPFMDSVTTVPAFIAQVLMVMRYRESWYYWMVIDVGSVAMWVIAGDWCMVAQFIFWTANCIYGLYKWS